MKRLDSVIGAIGNTPLIELKNIKKEYNLKANIFAKVEFFNPAGSIKDRASLFMIEKAEKQGLKKGGTIIEPTSGNTGIGLAMISAVKGYKAVIVMPNSMSKERIALMQAYGAEVVLTDGKLGMQGAIDKALEIKNNIENSVILSQFDNDANPLSHYETTAREIERDLDGKIDLFIAGVGTGGTLCGSAKYFREKGLDVKIIGVEPKSSPLITKGEVGAHKIQGIGANFIPKNFNKRLVDEVIAVADDEAIEFTKMVAKTEGLLVGLSSGASLVVAVNLAKKEENEDKNIVVVFPDSGTRYLSDGIFT